MTISVELLNEEALLLLQQLERLRLIKLSMPLNKTVSSPDAAKSRFAGRISSKTAKALQKQLEQMKEEWR